MVTASLVLKMQREAKNSMNMRYRRLGSQFNTKKQFGYRHNASRYGEQHQGVFWWDAPLACDLLLMYELACEPLLNVFEKR